MLLNGYCSGGYEFYQALKSRIKIVIYEFGIDDTGGVHLAERKEIKAAAEMKKLMAAHFLELDRAAKSGGKEKVAWCTSVGPAELLRAFGFKVYFPENHSAILATNRTSVNYIPVANAAGYSPEICSYLTGDIGAYIKGETPLKKIYGIDRVPRPDVLVYSTNQCRDVQEWFAYYSRQYKVPLIGINPPKNIGELADCHVADAESQLRSLVPALEKISGVNFDEKMLRQTVGLSRDASELWQAVLDSGAHVPSPLTFFDGTIHMGPIVVMRGTKEAVEYYRLLHAEMKQKIKDGEAAVDGEMHRLYWDGMPIWGKLRDLSSLFLELKTCVVASTYCNSWVFTGLDPEKPFRSMAEAYTRIFINRSEDVKEKYMGEMAKKFSLDGIIFHDSKTCANNSNTRYGMPARLQKKLGAPTLTISGDLCDLRCYSEEQAKTNIEAFIEQLSQAK
jgi:benzoyl-CoA reductase/2-hydroxyglutaryl-CoA dehydratase subunit BcrC/BadD/HgdB